MPFALTEPTEAEARGNWHTFFDLMERRDDLRQERTGTPRARHSRLATEIFKQNILEWWDDMERDL